MLRQLRDTEFAEGPLPLVGVCFKEVLPKKAKGIGKKGKKEGQKRGQKRGQPGQSRSFALIRDTQMCPKRLLLRFLGFFAIRWAKMP